jgi:CHAT domain-containing protein
MAALPRCLCLILTLWVVGSRPSATIRTGSNESDPWWGTKEAREIRQAAERFRAAGNFAAAEAADQHGLDLARQRHDDRAAFVYLASIGAGRLLQSQYRSALEVLLEARDLAERANNATELGAIAVNLSSLYLQVWDVDSAWRIAEEGLAKGGSLPRAYFRLPLLLQLGRVHQSIGDNRASDFFVRAIEEARIEGDAAQEARSWDLLGEERQRTGDLWAADADFTEAFRLRVLEDRADLAFSYARLGAVKLAENDCANDKDGPRGRQKPCKKPQNSREKSPQFRGLSDAARFTEAALAASEKHAPGLPLYFLLHQRGQVLLAQGDTRGALRDFSAALDQAQQWRRGVLPARQSLIAANTELEKRIFRSYIETSASESLRTGDARLASESFQAVERNRAASLRESIDFSSIWRETLGPDYKQALSELRTAEAALARGDGRAGEAASRLKLNIAEMESKAGASFPENEAENFLRRNSLIHFQEGLGTETLLLSLHVGERESYLWAVTNRTLSLHRLPAAAQIRSEIARFRDAVRSGAERHQSRGKAPTGRTLVGRGFRKEYESGHIGERLYAELFGALSRRETNKREWLLSLDDALFELPFAALLTERKDGNVTYLIEEHSVQVVPGAMFLARSQARIPDSARHAASDWFMGLGDPIYNTADSRWTGAGRPFTFGGWFAYAGTAGSQWPTGAQPGAQLSRLVGSAAEVESSARSWTAVSGTAMPPISPSRIASTSSSAFSSSAASLPRGTSASLLEGVNARRDDFLAMAARRPAIIHLATHILTSAAPNGTSAVTSVVTSNRGEGLIAFGLGSTGEVEVLSAADIAQLEVPGAVVAMSGCASGAGDIRAGAGLLGLTRAWQMAGARAVISTAWPVEDTTGELFGAFYHHLRELPPSEALRQSQIEMLRSGTWRSAPGYWASYQVTGGASQ